jgi:hypothetical protein
MKFCYFIFSYRANFIHMIQIWMKYTPNKQARCHLLAMALAFFTVLSSPSSKNSGCLGADFSLPSSPSPPLTRMPCASAPHHLSRKLPWRHLPPPPSSVDPSNELLLGGLLRGELYRYLSDALLNWGWWRTDPTSPAPSLPYPRSRGPWLALESPVPYLTHSDASKLCSLFP